jgi:hypothetical protein
MASNFVLGRSGASRSLPAYASAPERPAASLAGLFAHPVRTFIHALVMYMLLQSLTGCGLITIARVTMNEPITQEDVAFIVPGETRLADVVQRLGAPDELMGAEEGAVIAYHFRDLKYSRVNFGTLLRFWSPVQPDLITSGTGLGTDVFQVAFNRDWIVQHHAFAKHVPPTSRFIPWPF